MSAILTATQAAELLGLHVSTVRQHAAAGLIPGKQIGRQWRFVSDAIMAYISGEGICRRGKPIDRTTGERNDPPAIPPMCQRVMSCGAV